MTAGAAANSSAGCPGTPAGSRRVPAGVAVRHDGAVVVPPTTAAAVAELIDRAHRGWVHRGGLPIPEADELVEACRRGASLANVLGMFASAPVYGVAGLGPAGSTLTASQAAEVLGVTAQQVRRLCARGDLLAEKRARDWAIDAASVARRRNGT